MLRRLLTLLAVICGFALAAEPARAVPADVVSVAQTADKGEVAAVALVLKPFARAIMAVARVQRQVERNALELRVNTVELRIDRARE